MTPVLCDVCRRDPKLSGVLYAAVIRDTELPARCVICGFRLDEEGRRLPTP